MGTITTQIGNPSKGHAYKIIEIEDEEQNDRRTDNGDAR
jgi:hypothetical protein